MIRLVSDLKQHILADEYTRLLYAVILSWGFCDTASTYLAIAAYGSIEYELNPIAYQLLDFHLYALTGGKGVAVLAVGLIAVFGREMIRSVPFWKEYFKSLALIGAIVSLLNLLAVVHAIT